MSTKKKPITRAKVKALKVGKDEKQLLDVDAEFDVGIKNAEVLEKQKRVKIIEKY